MDESTSIPLPGEQLEALVLFRDRLDRFEQNGTAPDKDEAYKLAVEAYKLLAPFYESYASDWDSGDSERWTFLAMTCAPCGGGRFVFREPAVRGIIEGFEREIAEDSSALYIVHDGKAEAREVTSWERFLCYGALEFFVKNIPDEDRNGALRDCFERAQAILNNNELTVNRLKGRNPTANAAHHDCICTFLRRLENCGLPVTSLDGPSLTKAMDKAWGISEHTIAKSWRDASPLIRPNRPRRVRRCAGCGNPAGEGARRDGTYLDLFCRACQRRRRA